MIKFSPFSRKQLDLLTWWVDESPKKDCEGIIADGAIRSGKTVAMALSFLMWSMTRFSGENFGLCGKTIGSLRRNVIKPLKEMALTRGYKVIEHRADNYLSISRNGKTNDYYMFGGRDERSQDLIQGVTLAGCLFDEVALMPYSFVNQATARCSVEGSKLWFNCNPGSPMHWFKVEYIDRADLLGYIYLHFTMDDNTSLSEKIKERYRRQYVGVFFQRYILGLWTIAEGLIYPMFDDGNMYDDTDRPVSLYSAAHRTIACDYGTTNPCVFLDIWDDGQTVWVDNEYRWDSKSDEARNSGIPNKTDAQYADDLAAFMGDDPAKMCMVIIDPSAKSFITELQQRGFWTKAGDNDVLDGIRKTASLFGGKKIRVHRRCRGLIGELQSYAWDEKAVARGEEKPLKVLDHAPDGLRYYINSLPDWRISA
jgi:PBSX family phage terminase large subunit